MEHAIAAGIDWRDLVRSQLDQLGHKEGVPKPLDSKAHDIVRHDEPPGELRFRRHGKRPERKNGCSQLLWW